jgi:formylglycine-generating enzyme
VGTAQAISLDFVYVGNPGNANDPATGGLYGGVNYAYAMGKYDVTLNQYTAFLNAVATTGDPYGLYNSEGMATFGSTAGIQQTLVSSGYSYSVIGDGQRPVTWVGWFDAARFCNWLHNGQPTGTQGAGTTETGAYTLNGITSGGLNISKNANARFWIPSENEWHKAAYYDPNKGGQGVGGYWQYPTRSDIAPDNNYLIPSLPNQANCRHAPDGVFSVTQSATYVSFQHTPFQNYLTPVGAFINSASAYGTFDQGGNVFQWNDAVIGSIRGLRGGSWNCEYNYFLHVSFRGDEDDIPSAEDFAIGFRVASVAATAVPIPSISRTGAATVTLSWSAYTSGWTLQQTPLLIPAPCWTNVTTPPTVVDGQYQVAVTLSSSDSRFFFRLSHP